MEWRKEGWKDGRSGLGYSHAACCDARTRGLSGELCFGAPATAVASRRGLSRRDGPLREAFTWGPGRQVSPAGIRGSAPPSAWEGETQARRLCHFPPSNGSRLAEWYTAPRSTHVGSGEASFPGGAPGQRPAFVSAPRAEVTFTRYITRYPRPSTGTTKTPIWNSLPQLATQMPPLPPLPTGPMRSIAGCTSSPPAL